MKVAKSLILDMSFACNLDCATCLCPKIDLIRGKPTLSQSDCLWLVSEFARLGGSSVLIFGGEPLLVPHLYEVVTAATRAGLLCEVTTNGTALTESNCAKLLDANLSGLTISIDGNRDAHDSIRGGGSFERAERGATVFAEKKVERSHHCELNIHCTISRKNHNAFRQLIDVAERIGSFVAVSISYMSRLDESDLGSSLDILSVRKSEGLGHWDLPKELLLRPQDLPSLNAEMEVTIERAAAKGVPLKVDKSLYPEPNANGLCSGKHSLSKRCNTVEDCIIVGPEGQISACPMLTDVWFGDIWKKKSEDIFLDRSKFGTLEQVLEDGFLPICASCCNHEELM